MIVCKLSEILGRKRLKISDVIRDTGITRPTLTSLYYGKSAGISFETLDKLCKYLSKYSPVSVNDLFVFYDIDINSIHISFKSLTQGIAPNSNHTIVETADLEGCIKFEQKQLNDLVFNGSVCFSDYDSKKHNSNYSLRVNFYEINRQDFFSLYPYDVQEDIDKRIIAFAELWLNEYDCEAEIKYYDINYK